MLLRDATKNENKAMLKGGLRCRVGGPRHHTATAFSGQNRGLRRMLFICTLSEHKVK